MIISRTPFRLSFFGGGTDYREWYLKEGGSVLSAAINKYCYISARYFPPHFGVRHRIVWSHIELANSASEILHPAVKEGLRYLGFDEQPGLEIHHQGDLPARSGIGSSSSFSVGFLHALSGLRGKMVSKQELALKAIDFEQNVLKECVGSQDQMAAAYGGLNRFNFNKNGEIQRLPIPLSPARVEQLESRLMMFYLGASRLGSELASHVVASFKSKRSHLIRMRDLVDEAIRTLGEGNDLDDFGSLLHEAWELKRSLANGSTSPAVHEAYKLARAAGALGGKLMGAGGTGFMFFYVPLEKQAAVRKALSHHLYVPVKIDWEGSVIVLYDRH